MTVQEQIRVIQAASAKACQSPEAARKFLKDAGITDLIEEEAEEMIPVIALPTPTLKRK